MKRAWVILVAVSVMTVGCQSQNGNHFDAKPTGAVDTRRDTELAGKLNAQAAELIREGKLEEAETKLKAALSADMFYGPAHNNLGTLYQKQERYYEAAWEFQYATKLMPGKAQPKNNLGLVFESVGRLEESARWYEEALTLEPDSVEITENLARVMVRTNRHSERTKQLLSDIVMKERRPEWTSWAREQLTMIGQPQPTSTPRPDPPAEEDK